MRRQYSISSATAKREDDVNNDVDEAVHRRRNEKAPHHRKEKPCDRSLVKAE